MIIILEPEKDTYVTNLKTQNNDASLANVGHAATLDLFKLYNENKHSKSWGVFNFQGALTNNEELKLIDVDGNEVTFIIKDDVTSNIDGVNGSEFGKSQNANDEITLAGNFITGKKYKILSTSDGGDITNFTDIGADNNNVGTLFIASGQGEGTGTAIVENSVTIGISGKVQGDYSELLKNIINKVSSFDNGLSLNMTAHNNSNNELVLKQNKAGDSGDTIFTLPTNMLHMHGLDSFARIDYSNLLIKFDLENFKKEWHIAQALNGAFSTLYADLILKDVTTGISKPKEYSLELFKLIKDFDEGIGKDTIHFSDSDTSNFKDLSESEQWEIQDYISILDALSISSTDIDIDKGDEDLVFNITSYIKNELVKGTVDVPTLDDKGFLVKFDDNNIYNNKSYFVKRLGSRHLINKQFVPQLRIKIDDSSYNIPTNSFNKVRYLDSTEEFYLFNRANGLHQSFKAPVDFDINTMLKMKISSRDISPVDFVTLTANNHAVNPITNFSGGIISGIRKVTLSDTQLSRFNSNISDKIKNNKLEAKITWFWDNEQDIHIISEENTQFVVSENINETKYENLITSIRITENDLFANNSTNAIEVYFVDTKKEFNAVKVPYELPSENLGDVYYQLYNVETGNILLDYDNPATKMFYDGEKYKFNLFVPRLFKNLRVNFKFKYKDVINNVDKYIFNKKYSVRIL